MPRRYWIFSQCEFLRCYRDDGITTKDDDMTTVSLSKKFLDSSRWLPLAMLVLLHLALWLGVESIWSRPFLMTHFGLFLLWQPLWRGEQALRPGSVIFILCANVIALWWLNWWVLTFWVSSLFALVGGRVFAFQAKRQRLRYLLVMAYLLSALLLWIAPQLFGLPIVVDATRKLMGVALPIVLAALALIPGEDKQADTAQAVDFIYSLLLFMLLTLLVLGSLAFMTLGYMDYLEALVRTLFVMALLLFVLGWLWNPRPIFAGLQSGFTGLQPVFSRYLLNIGTPFEAWLKQLAESAQQETSPAIFLARATDHLAALPWLSGLEWSSDEGQGTLGTPSQHRIRVEEQGLQLTLFSRQAVAPSVLLHIHLLTQLLGHFYQAKLREQRLREMTRLQAIYETGARLTHDLKNMLQSLFALTSISQRREEEFVPLLRRQLPALAQRIEMTLAKLKSPQIENEAPMQPVAAWWDNLRRRHQDETLEWVCEQAVTEQNIPAALFDFVADNLIANALNKRQRQPGILIRVVLTVQPLTLSVSDNGDAIPEHLASQVLNTVVMSEDGLGVGLYQAARWASQLGFKLILKKNEVGSVCFELGVQS